jgi:hypothetical protein
VDELLARKQASPIINTIASRTRINAIKPNAALAGKFSV